MHDDNEYRVGDSVYWEDEPGAIHTIQETKYMKGYAYPWVWFEGLPNPYQGDRSGLKNFYNPKYKEGRTLVNITRRRELAIEAIGL